MQNNRLRFSVRARRLGTPTLTNLWNNFSQRHCRLLSELKTDCRSQYAGDALALLGTIDALDVAVFRKTHAGIEAVFRGQAAKQLLRAGSTEPDIHGGNLSSVEVDRSG